MPVRTKITRALCAVAAAAAVAAAMAIAAVPEDGGAAPRAEVVSVSGDVGRSAETGALALQASRLRPGATVAGSAHVINSGPAGGRFWLTRAGLAETPGPGGGKLSDRLQLTVLDTTDQDLPVIVYSGSIESIDRNPLGYIAPGRSRSYSVAATFIPGEGPDDGPGGDDAYRGASTRVSLQWSTDPPLARRPQAPRAPSAAGRTAVRSGRSGRDQTPPRLRIGLPARQPVFATGRLAVQVRCSEPCRVRVAGRARAEPAPLPLPRAGSVTRGRPRTARRLVLRLRPRARRAVRAALQGGRVIKLRLSVTARDRAGNQAQDRHSVRLTPGS